MSYFKNTSSQYIDFVMRGFDGEPETGLVATLSGTCNKDGGSYAACTGAITEYGTSGVYRYAASQSEMNGDVLHFLFADSSGDGLSAFREVVTVPTDGISTFDPTTDEVNVGEVKGTAVSGPDDLKADVSAIAIEANVQGHAAAALTAYDPPTRTEATSDKNEVIAEVDVNEVKIDAIQADLNNPDQYKADVSGLAPANEYDAEFAAIQADLDNPDQYKADVSGLSTFDPATDEVDIGKVKGVAVAGVDDFKADVSGLSADLEFIKHIEGGRWKIENDQMIFYEDDNITEVARFDLFDSSGNPSEVNVFDRQRV